MAIRARGTRHRNTYWCEQCGHKKVKSRYMVIVTQKFRRAIFECEHCGMFCVNVGSTTTYNKSFVFFVTQEETIEFIHKIGEE